MTCSPSRLKDKLPTTKSTSCLVSSSPNSVLGRARCVAQLNEFLPRMQEALGDCHKVLTLYGCDHL